MSTETHINQFVTEIEEKYKKAVGAVGELKDAIDALKSKVISMSPEVREAIGMGEKALEGAEQKTEESDTKADGGNKASAADSSNGGSSKS